MINRIIAIQGNHPSKLNPQTDTSIFLANEIQKKNYRILTLLFQEIIIIGFFVFTVRVEEFRNGIKIGEVRRDVQYASN